MESLAFAVAVQAEVPQLHLLFHVAHQTLGIYEVLNVWNEKPVLPGEMLRERCANHNQRTATRSGGRGSGGFESTETTLNALRGEGGGGEVKIQRKVAIIENWVT